MFINRLSPIWSLVARHNSLKKLCNSLQHYFSLPRGIKPYSYDPLEHLVRSSEGVDLKNATLHLHAHYGDSSARALEVLNHMPSGNILISSSKTKVLENFQKVGLTRNRLVLNVGRNFGALHQVLDDIDTPFLIHVHEKKSLHLPKKLAGNWRDNIWHYLVPESRDKGILETALGWLQESDKNVICYLGIPDLLGQRNYNWGPKSNIDKYREFSALAANIKSEDYFGYPMGGMFVARVEYISRFMKDFNLEDFSEEPLIVDGAFEHFLERYVSYQAMILGLNQAVIDPTRSAIFSNHFHAIYLSAKIRKRGSRLLRYTGPNSPSKFDFDS